MITLSKSVSIETQINKTIGMNKILKTTVKLRSISTSTTLLRSIKNGIKILQVKAKNLERSFQFQIDALKKQTVKDADEEHTQKKTSKVDGKNQHTPNM
jgi:hypothetical protein